MNDHRLSLLCAAALAFGCSAGVSGKTGTGGSTAPAPAAAAASRQRRTRRQLVDRRLQRHRRQLLERRCHRHRRQPRRRVRRLHRGRPAGAARSLLPDGQLEVDGGPDGRGDVEVDRGQLGAQHLLHTIPGRPVSAWHSSTSPTCRAGPRRAATRPPRPQTAAASDPATTATPVSRADAHHGFSPLCLTSVTAAPRSAPVIRTARTEPMRAGPTAPRTLARPEQLPHRLQIRRLLPPARHLHHLQVRDAECRAGTSPGAAGGLQHIADRPHARRVHADRPGAGRRDHVGQAAADEQPEHKVAIVLVTDGLPGGFIPGFPPAECAPAISLASPPSSAARPPGRPDPHLRRRHLQPHNQRGTDGAGEPEVAGSGRRNRRRRHHRRHGKHRHPAAARRARQGPDQGDRLLVLHPAVDGRHGRRLQQGQRAVHRRQRHLHHRRAHRLVVGVRQGRLVLRRRSGGRNAEEDRSCPSTCSQFNADVSGHVDIVLGCATISVG